MEDCPFEEVAVGAVVALTFLVGFGRLSLDYQWVWIAFPVGVAGCIPLAVGLVRLSETRRESEMGPNADALESLRDRYVRSEIDEAEFEDRLGMLLETESVPATEAYAVRSDDEWELVSEGRRGPGRTPTTSAHTSRATQFSQKVNPGSFSVPQRRQSPGRVRRHSAFGTVPVWPFQYARVGVTSGASPSSSNQRAR